MAAAYGLLMAALVLGLGGGGAPGCGCGRRARGDAERARGEAIRARDDLKGALQRTETAEGAAEKARDDLQGHSTGAGRQAPVNRVRLRGHIYLAQHEWDAGHLERARKLLQEAGDLQEELTPGRRPWEWDYFNRLLHAEAAVLQGHAGQINSVSFSPDGRRVVTASADHTPACGTSPQASNLPSLRGIIGTSPLPSSAPTEPASPRRGAATIGRGCGTPHPTNRSPSCGVITAGLTACASAPTEPSSRRRATTGRRGCGTPPPTKRFTS